MASVVLKLNGFMQSIKQGGQEVILIVNLDKERGREGQREGEGKRGKRETAIPVSFSAALEAKFRLYFITFPGKDITKN